MSETIKERKDRLNEMHKVWIEVTGSALTEVHKTDGFKGDRDDYRAAASTQESTLSAKERFYK